MERVRYIIVGFNSEPSEAIKHLYVQGGVRKLKYWFVFSMYDSNYSFDQFICQVVKEKMISGLDVAII